MCSLHSDYCKLVTGGLAVVGDSSSLEVRGRKRLARKVLACTVFVCCMK